MADKNNQTGEQENLSQLLQIRRDKLKELQESGNDPFTITRYFPFSGWTVLISLRSESKGSSNTRGISCSKMFLSRPSASAASTKAVSVGSPAVFPSGASTVSLHNAPMVSTSRRCLSPQVHTCWTVMRFMVRVPVLSEQITPAQPRVSTAGSFFTMALCFTIRCTPKASTMVTMAGRPSGMAATARDTAAISISRMGRWYSRPTPNITAHTARHTKDRVLEISAIFRWRGVSPSFSPSSIPAMRPTSVSMPVAVTMAWALP